jgi:hypothetical protein
MPNFMCATVIDAVSAKRSICQLWNPPGSGVLLNVTNCILAHSGSATSGFDIRQSDMPVGTKIINPKNKYLGGPVSAAELRGATVSPSAIPGTVIHEEWINARFEDHTYPFDPPVVIPQGWGLHAASAHDALYLVATFEFSESPDPAGAVYTNENGMLLGSVGDVNTSLGNGILAFDSSENTFADFESAWFNIGKMWPEEMAVDRFVLKSPPGRSFTGSLPVRTLQWTLEAYENGEWHNVATGTHAETAYNIQQTIDVILPATSTATGHRVFIQGPASAVHRVGHMAFHKSL